MDFDGGLFDINFDELAMFDGQQQQGQSQTAAKAATALDFQEFCNDFSTPDEDLGTVPEWKSSLKSNQQPDSNGADAFDFGFSTVKGDFDTKDSFDGLAPLDSDLQGLFSFNFGSDAQVVPDMPTGAAHTPDFMLPIVTQPAMAATQPQQGLSDPYSWVQSMGHMPLGYPARPRPSNPQARQESLNRYRDKKARRFNNSTKVRYEMRKVNADKRPRIKGRFVKPEELQRHLQSVVVGSPISS